MDVQNAPCSPGLPLAGAICTPAGIPWGWSEVTGHKMWQNAALGLLGLFRLNKRTVD